MKKNLDYLKEYYRGDMVSAYEKSRETTPSWNREQRALERFLLEANLPEGSRVLDVPVGTGRFLPLYAAHRYEVIGLDISEDMIEFASSRSEHMRLLNATFEVADARATNLADNSVDLVVSVRFLVHMDLEEIETIVSGLARVSSRYLIVHIRIASPYRRGRVVLWRRRAASLLRRIRSLLYGYPLVRDRWQHREGAKAASSDVQKDAAKRKVANKAATIHTWETIRDVFEEHRLEVVRQAVVNPTDMGYESRMFLLERRR